MATPAQIDAALAALRAARQRVFDASQLREAAILRRARIVESLVELNERIDAERAAMFAARDALRALLAEPETEPV
jgi:hypothetical protein